MTQIASENFDPGMRHGFIIDGLEDGIENVVSKTCPKCESGKTTNKGVFATELPVFTSTCKKCGTVWMYDVRHNGTSRRYKI